MEGILLDGVARQVARDIIDEAPRVPIALLFGYTPADAASNSAAKIGLLQSRRQCGCLEPNSIGYCGGISCALVMPVT